MSTVVRSTGAALHLAAVLIALWARADYGIARDFWVMTCDNVKLAQVGVKVSLGGALFLVAAGALWVTRSRDRFLWGQVQSVVTGVALVAVLASFAVTDSGHPDECAGTASTGLTSVLAPRP